MRDSCAADQRRASLNVPPVCRDFLLRIKGLDHACFLPEFYGVAINQLSGTAFGFLIILANDLDSVRDVPILAYDEGIIAVHSRSDAGLVWSLQLGPRMRSRPSKPRYLSVAGGLPRRAAGLLLLIGKQVF